MLCKFKAVHHPITHKNVQCSVFFTSKVTQISSFQFFISFMHSSFIFSLPFFDVNLLSFSFISCKSYIGGRQRGYYFTVLILLCFKTKRIFIYYLAVENKWKPYNKRWKIENKHYWFIMYIILWKVHSNFTIYMSSVTFFSVKNKCKIY